MTELCYWEQEKDQAEQKRYVLLSLHLSLSMYTDSLDFDRSLPSGPYGDVMPIKSFSNLFL